MQYNFIIYNLFKVESQGTEYIFHIGQVSALYKINNIVIPILLAETRIFSHWASFRLIHFPPWTSLTVLYRLRIPVFLDMMTYGKVEHFRRFRRTCCLRIQVWRVPSFTLVCATAGSTVLSSPARNNTCGHHCYINLLSARIFRPWVLLWLWTHPKSIPVIMMMSFTSCDVILPKQPLYIHSA
jgi:hypothetical protein